MRDLCLSLNNFRKSVLFSFLSSFFFLFIYFILFHSVIFQPTDSSAFLNSFLTCLVFISFTFYDNFITCIFLYMSCFFKRINCIFPVLQALVTVVVFSHIGRFNWFLTPVVLNLSCTLSSGFSPPLQELLVIIFLLPILVWPVQFDFPHFPLSALLLTLMTLVPIAFLFFKN